MKSLHPLLALHRAIHNAPDVIPKGFKTTGELAKEMKLSRPTAQRILKTLTDAGKMEIVSFRVTNNAGIVKPVPHYRAKSK